MSSSTVSDALPVIDVSALVSNAPDGWGDIARQINDACRHYGFFYITGHGVSQALINRLEAISHAFFERDMSWKMQWEMARGGRAWRGYFPTGGELTSNRPDWKEGIYFGTELQDTHPDVRAGLPLHGKNLFPAVDGLRETVLDYLDATTRLGQRLVAVIALSLGLPADYLQRLYTADPLILFRIFNYPSQAAPVDMDVQWGVGEHTDYGLLTILHQDTIGGLEVRTPRGWIQAPPIPGTFVCNIGDMLDFLTGGLYKSTPHRVRRNTSGRDRLSFPLFFDPNFHARIRPFPEGLGGHARDDSAERWDHTNVHAFDGTYGDYLLNKVGKVFPALRDDALSET